MMCLMVNGRRRVMAGVPVVEFVLQAGPCVAGGSLLPGVRSSAHRKSSMRAGEFILSRASKLTRQIERMAGCRPLVAANAGNRTGHPLRRRRQPAVGDGD